MSWDIEISSRLTVDDLKLLEELLLLSSPQEKIAACFSYDHCIKRITKWVDKACTEHDSAKDISRSINKRAEGNKVFAGREPLMAVLLYGEALRYAPHNSPEEQLAFANRSAVFMYAQNYQDCLADVNRALPKSEGLLRLKLLARKCKAALHLGQKSAWETLEVIKSTQWDIPEGKLKSVIKDIEEEFSKKSVNHYSETSDIDIPIPEPLGGFNPDFPSASKNVELRENKEKGKHVIAKTDLEIGSVIFVEKPSSYVILQELALGFCQFCCLETRAYIPCKMCSKVVFCNENCRDQAWEIFHRFECPNGIEMCHNVGIAHLALRMTLQKIYYPPSLELINHLDKMDCQDQWRYVLMAVTLLLFIKREVPEMTANSDLGGRILVHIAELISNGQAIDELTFYNSSRTDLDIGTQVIAQENSVRVATGIYPAASKMNHSCVRHITTCFHGITLIVKATAPIKAGQEVFNSYGVNCSRMLKDDRQSALKEQYCFDCDCEACTSPVDPALGYFALKCLKCGSPFIEPKCTSCGTVPSSTFMLEVNKLRKNPSKLDINEPRKSLKLLQADLVQQRKYLHPYNILIFENLDNSATCHVLSGQYVEGFKLLKQSVDICQVLFGPFSAELGNQLIKQLDICMTLLLDMKDLSNLDQEKRKILKQCKGDFVRALQIIELHFGSWSKRYYSLKLQSDIFLQAFKTIKHPSLEN